MKESIYCYGIITECYIITRLLLETKTKKKNSCYKQNKKIDETKSYMTSQDTDFYGKMLLFLYNIILLCIFMSSDANHVFFYEIFL